MFVVLPSALRSLHLLLLIAPFNSLFFYIHFIILTSWFRRWVLKHALSPSPLIRQPRVKLVLTDGDFLLEHLLEKQNTDFHRQTYTQIILRDKDGGGLCAASFSRTGYKTNWLKQDSPINGETAAVCVTYTYFTVTARQHSKTNASFCFVLGWLN